MNKESNHIGGIGGMIDKFELVYKEDINGFWERLIKKINEMIYYIDTLYSAQMNPVDIMWHLLGTPEEERINTAHLWDLCEEEIEIGNEQRRILP